MADAVPAERPEGWGSIRFPPARWLRTYQRAWLSQDLLAGLTLAAYAIPVSLAYASLAGLPPQCGVYCYLLGGLAYALLGTSRQLAIGPTSAIAMLVGTTVAEMAAGVAGRWLGIASLSALIVALLSGVAWLLRLSSLVSFISETILLGFKAGAALTIALTQLPKLFGVPGGGDSFFERLWVLAGQLPQTNAYVLGFGVVALLLLLQGERLFPGRPVALAIVVLSILVMSLTSLADRGVSVVGALPAGLPELRWPSLRMRDVEGVVPLAAACLLLSYIESISAARAIAAKHGYDIDPRQELLALGGANLAVAFGQGFPVAGGLSQSAVNDQSGARSPLSIVVASLALGLCLLYLTDLLRNLPHVVLAAILLVAIRGLLDWDGLWRARQVSRTEFRIAMVALLGVLWLGILKGVLLATVASLLIVISAAAHPRVAFLGRIPGTRRFSDLAQHPENEALPGVLIFRVEASLLYFNVDSVRQTVWARVLQTVPLQLVVCDLSNCPALDVSGARLLARLQAELASRGVQFRCVEAHAQLRDTMLAVGLPVAGDGRGHFATIEDVLAESSPTTAL